MTERPCALSGKEHARNRTRVQCSDVDAEPRAERRDLLDLGGIICHDGARADREQDVRDVVDRDIVGDAVYERGRPADLIDDRCMHDILSIDAS